ncbi:hypothetical protein V6N11_053322 [Hibiscus sabdariffa]|uniref:RNase H type-1 domain-containing protein n=1 Tax=Hibiscus sabdariffa TaxID=183260 RepID=A0ABR2UCP3_9ROSI
MTETKKGRLRFAGLHVHGNLAWKGLEFAIDLGFHSVIVESDCRAVISKLCSNILDLSDTGLCHPEDMFWVEDASDRIHRLTAADKRFIAPP